MKEKKGIRKFGWARAFVVFWLGILGIGYLANIPLLGVVFMLAMLYVIFMDLINERFAKRTEPEEKPEASYDPKAHKETIKCPFCKKSIPSDISFCYYCGKSLDEYKRIEAIRKNSLEKIDSALDSIEDGAPKENVQKIRNLTDKILKKYREKAKDEGDSRKFTDYYLPKTVSAIEHYKTLCTLEDLDPDELKIKSQIEDSLEMIAEAFTNIFNRASTEGLYDMSVDINVLEKILKQEGLTDSDFK